MSFILGQISILKAYNPLNMEKNAMEFIVETYYVSCLEEAHKTEYCKVKSQKYGEQVKAVWHNKAWKNY